MLVYQHNLLHFGHHIQNLNHILQTSSSQVTLAGQSGVTVNGTPGLKIRTQWSSATIVKRAANTWVAMGDLVA